MSFAIKVDARLRALESRADALAKLCEDLSKIAAELKARLEAQEAKRGPGRPPNERKDQR